jgi:deferrochelatase/peroxidase EfeB
LAKVDVSAEPEFADVQGLLRFGYKHHTEGAFALLRVRNRAAARAWLAAAPVGSAARGALSPTVLQIAFSAPGLHELGVPDAVTSAFAPEFLAGLGTDSNRARRLGDVGNNDPAHWQWGGTSEPLMPHVLVMVYAMPGRLAERCKGLESNWAVAFELLRWLPTTDMGGVEPFGFTDGVSQPEIDWSRELAAEDHDSLAYRNVSCLGEFLLGYPNEYGRYTARPLLEAVGAAATQLPRAEDAPARADLGRNGSYVVLRTLRQDAPGFWRFLDKQAGGDAAERQRIAEAMVGRRMDGHPLVPASTTPIQGVGPDAAARARNGFTFDDDLAGLRCPVGAHIRRANPRNPDLPAGTRSLVSRAVRMLGFDSAVLHGDAVASVRFHRVLRRGREYGLRMTMNDALARPATPVETGLQFVCLCADLARQFEFVQGAWIASTKFAGLPHEGDPLMGNRLAAPDELDTARFTMPREGGTSRVIEGLPTFVEVVGGAYFFLPGVRALRYLVTA